MFEIIVQTINYITTASFFYPSMGITAASSVFIGAAIYNGDIKSASKGIITVGSYVGLLVIMSLARIWEVLANEIIQHSPIYMAYAGILTAIFLGLYYILGIVIGVYVMNRMKAKKK